MVQPMEGKMGALVMFLGAALLVIVIQVSLEMWEAGDRRASVLYGVGFGALAVALIIAPWLAM
jgi:hypothetical protein